MISDVVSYRTVMPGVNFLPTEGGRVSPVAIMRWVPATNPDIRQFDNLAISSLEYQLEGTEQTWREALESVR